MKENAGTDCSRRHVARAIQAIERLRQTSKKLTGPRQQILTVLEREPHPLSIREVLRHMPPGSCDLATVYRSMHLLENMGLVKRYDFGDGAARFELIGAGHAHHHHLVCKRCARVIELEGCFAEELEQRIAAENNFKHVTHRLEFFGICPRCQ